MAWALELILSLGGGRGWCVMGSRKTSDMHEYLESSEVGCTPSATTYSNPWDDAAEVGAHGVQAVCGNGIVGHNQVRGVTLVEEDRQQRVVAGCCRYSVRAFAHGMLPMLIFLVLIVTLRPWVRERSPALWVDSHGASLTSLPRASLAGWPPPPPPSLCAGSQE